MKRLCVLTGSYPGARGLELVYGGAHIGLMGALADTGLAKNGPVVGEYPAEILDAFEQDERNSRQEMEA